MELFRIIADGNGNIGLCVHGDDEPVLEMALADDSDAAFIDAVRRMTTDYCENAR